MDSRFKPIKEVRPRKRTGLVKYLIILVVGIPAVLLIRAFLVEPVRIDGVALDPGLKDRDRVFINKRVGQIARGDIVMFGHPEKPSIRMVLRVVGMPGERIQLHDGLLYVNGQETPESYVSPEHNVKRSTTDEIETPPDSYFVLGDNRDEAFDSRKMGPVPRSLIYGKVWIRYWPM